MRRIELVERACGNGSKGDFEEAVVASRFVCASDPRPCFSFSGTVRLM